MRMSALLTRIGVNVSRTQTHQFCLRRLWLLLLHGRLDAHSGIGLGLNLLSPAPVCPETGVASSEGTSAIENMHARHDRSALVTPFQFAATLFDKSGLLLLLRLLHIRLSSGGHAAEDGSLG
jgi:hypothetical protein